MFTSVQNPCFNYADSKSGLQLQVMEFSLQLRVCSISPQTLEGLSIHSGKIFSSVLGCAKHIAQSCKLKAKVTVEGNGIDIEFHVHPIFSTLVVLAEFIGITYCE